MSDNIHDGHRERLRKRYAEHGLDSFDEHNMLELLLTYAIPRCDVNEIAHELMNRFGSLGEVFEAAPEELMKVRGVGKNAAGLIKLVPDLYRQCMLDHNKRRKNICFTNVKEAGQFFIPYFTGENEEAVYAAFLDDSLRLRECRLIFKGTLNSAAISARKMVEAAIAARATNVILAHNHPTGTLIPSYDDRYATAQIQKALEAVEIKLLDHMIVSGNMYISMKECGYLLHGDKIWDNSR